MLRLLASGRNNGVSTDLAMQCKTVSRPKLTFEDIKLDRYNSVAYIPGKHSWDACNITVEDDVTNKATMLIQSQVEAQQRLIGADGPWLNTEATASTFKFKTQLNMLDGNETILESWIMQGCYISHVDYGDLDYSASDVMTINLTLRFDHAYQIVAGNKLGTAIGGI
jgi:hypothetical protein